MTNGPFQLALYYTILGHNFDQWAQVHISKDELTLEAEMLPPVSAPVHIGHITHTEFFDLSKHIHEKSVLCI